MTDIAQYLSELDSQLHVGRKQRLAILEEVQDHLLESAERLSSKGILRGHAEVGATSAFGFLPTIAGQFNANAGAKAMRRAPVITVMAGLAVVALFLLAVTRQPKSIAQANVYQQATFLLSVISFQFYVIAGACGISRALAIWHCSTNSGSGREYVRRCTVISMTALTLGILTMSLNFLFDVHRASPTRGLPLTLSAISMLLVASMGLIGVIKLQVNPFSEYPDISSKHRNILFTSGESAIDIVRRFPVQTSLLATIVTSSWVMFRAETSSFFGAWPWGVTEAVSVIAGFYLLGPVLELRSAVLNP